MIRLLAACSSALVYFAAAAASAQTTFPAGGSVAFDNTQPSLALKYMVRVTGPVADLGEVALYPSNDQFNSTDPSGWMRAEGQLLNIDASTADLFGMLGTTFGGDGVNDFALPDLRGRTAIGASDTIPLGSVLGEEAVTLSELQMPSHPHTLSSGLTTGATGGGGSHSNYQPSLALTPIISNTGTFPSQSSLALATATGQDDPELAQLGAGTDPFYGEIAWIAHNSVPTGWFVADGRELPISQNMALFTLLGVKYGGNGETVFNLPDLRGRAPVGAGNAPGLPSRQVGSTYGVADETLTANQLPTHTHDLPDGLGTTDPTGGGQSQSNTQPSLAITYLLAEEGTYPSPSLALITAPGSEPTPEIAQIGSGPNPILGSITMFGGNFNPSGYFEASGQQLSVAQHTALFSLIWNTYGGDAMSNFNLPDLRSRLAVGIGQGTNLTNRTIGQTFGAEQHVLADANLPSHTHSFELAGDYNGDGAVDAADYTVWRDNNGQNVTLPGDVTPGAVTQEDYDVWVAHFGQSSLGVSVPEPAGALLAGLVLTALAARRLPPGSERAGFEAA